jgi:integrase
MPFAFPSEPPSAFAGILTEFAETDFLPCVRSTFADKIKTRLYYENGAKNLLSHDDLAGAPLDSMTTEQISGYVRARQQRGLLVASINRQLQVLRRMFHLAQEWRKVEKALPSVKMLPGERHRDRVLIPDEEARYLAKAGPLVRDVASILLDCGLRPEECFRLRWPSVRDGDVEIQYGKTDNARRRIPMSQRVRAILDMRQSQANSEWVFRAPTRSGHIEPSSLKKQHLRACKEAEIVPFPLYTLRHTCLTRWAPHMDPWTLAYLAGHRDMSITKRYVHPQERTVREAMDRARGGYNLGYSAESASAVVGSAVM